ncbi:Uncharacterized protein OBRU01_21619, partial [Operophtera brumata]
DQNETLSLLRWTPRKEQNGKTLTCRASHEKLDKKTIETNVPIAKVQLGSKINPHDIEEGDDVYFMCMVEANPPSYKGQIVTHNQQAGVIVGSSHLAFQRVSRGQAGRYSCTASNVEGDGRSPSINLSIF